jgi:tetratricopeptide (TPR) repeat protein
MDRANKRTAQVAMGVVLAGALSWGGVELRAAQDARREGDEAIKLLGQPIERAPELTQLPSARAIAKLELALKARSTERLQALLTWAQALDAAQKGKPEEARTSLASAQKRLLEESAAVRAELAVLEGAIALQLDDVDNAGRAARMALLLDARSLRARVLASDVAIEQKDASSALEQLDALGELASKHAGFVNRRGLALELRGDLEAARALYERAGVIDATFAQGHINLGRLLRDEGRHLQSEAAFGRAVQVAPNDHEPWLGRGLARLAQGELASAEHDLEQARALAPQASTPLIALADLDEARGDRGQAIDRYRAALLLTPAHAVASLKLGNALMRKGDYGGAKAAYETAIRHDVNLAAAHNGLGAARMALGDNDGALAALSTAVRLDERDPNPARNLELLRERMR